jgi:calcineurin-like phosphoesterase family protein
MLIDYNAFVISDTHFGDTAGIANGFENYVISRWNKAVSKENTVLHLGDFTSDDGSFAMEMKIQKYSKLLNGKIILIKGNHDSAPTSVYKENGIELINGVVDEHGNIIDNGVCSAAAGTFCGLKVLFSHYPVWDLYAKVEPPNWEEEDARHIPLGIFDRETDYLYKMFTKNKFDINIHGHIHEKIKRFKNLIDVSPDNIGYTPQRICDILKNNKH